MFWKGKVPMQANGDPPLLATLVFPCRRDQVMLATKMTGIGVGYLNGWGGKVEPDESIHACALREFTEETGGARVTKFTIEQDRFRNVGVVHVSNHGEDGRISKAEVFVYVVREWVGDIVSTEAMRKPTFYNIQHIHKLHLLPGDKFWLPHFLTRRHNGEHRRNMHAWVEYMPGSICLASEPIVICNDENDSSEDDLQSEPFAEF